MVKNSLNKIIGLSVLVIGLIAGLTLSKTNQNINESASPATSLSLTPSSQEVGLGGGSFATQVEINSGVNKVTGFDIQVTYDPSQINVKEIKPTTDIESFNTVIKNEIDNTNGKLRYAAFTFDKNLAVSGKLNILTIYGSPSLSSSLGSYELKFSPESIVVATGESQNVLINSSSATIKVVDGEPNSCGGTCGSNNNCKANYFCHEGYCRNPVCPSDKSCGCAVAQATATTKATVKPTIKPTTTSATIKPTVKSSATPKGGTGTSNPDSNATERPAIEFKTTSPETVTTDDLKNRVWTDFSKYLIGILLFIALAVVTFLGIKKYKKNKTYIMPPTNI